MTARERVRRPDGRTWRFHPETGREVHAENTPVGRVLVVLHTHDFDVAARMVSPRWSTLRGDMPLPEPVRAWRRFAFPQGAPGYRKGLDLVLRLSDGTDARSFPVVVYPLPPIAAKEPAA